MKLAKNQIDEMFAHARQTFPQECCGLIGGRAAQRVANSIYKLKNIAENPQAEYEAAAEDLFAAQREMREKNEILLAIYHSHPRQNIPEPSATDVRRAFYREAVYFIIGCSLDEYVLRAFRLDERKRRWDEAEFVVED